MCSKQQQFVPSAQWWRTSSNVAGPSMAPAGSCAGLSASAYMHDVARGDGQQVPRASYSQQVWDLQMTMQLGECITCASWKCYFIYPGVPGGSLPFHCAELLFAQCSDITEVTLVETLTFQLGCAPCSACWDCTGNVYSMSCNFGNVI